jgi:phosphoribosylformimino-5-aminoimidazole carboxamide ribotide isomerase
MTTGAPELLVAIDLAGGRVVRLTRGEMAAQTVYGDDPAAIASGWQDRGARWLHVVDLDGATTGEQANAGAVEQILRAVTIPVQVAGGIRSMDAIARWADLGATRVCLGTRSLDEGFLREALVAFGDLLVASVDSRAGEVQVAGWLEGSGAATEEIVGRVAEAGVARLMFTAIDRDGTLEGPDFAAIERVLAVSPVPVIASGGVGAAAHLSRLAGLAPRGVEGVVVGKALYSGVLELEEALAALSGPASPVSAGGAGTVG